MFTIKKRLESEIKAISRLWCHETKIVRIEMASAVPGDHSKIFLHESFVYINSFKQFPVYSILEVVKGTGSSDGYYFEVK